MIDDKGLSAALTDTPLSSSVESWLEKSHHVINNSSHGDLANWMNAVQSLPDIPLQKIDMNCDAISLSTDSLLAEETMSQLKSHLMSLHPWRKGPYDLFGVNVDSEWRSDFKWDRLKNQISSLENKLVLDVGCGNGYHLWRMRGLGCRCAVGIDPGLLFNCQFQAIKRYSVDEPVYMLPLTSEQFKAPLEGGFDAVFSMGIFYHRRSPIEHLYELKSFLNPGGELIFETLVVEGDHETVLIPENRYAQMRNVWMLPSTSMLERILDRCGFIDIHLIDVTETTSAEQRSTEWMRFKSLKDFLNPDNPHLTIEGYSAPTRAIFICKKPH